MRVQAVGALAAVGLILAGGGVAAASNASHGAGNGSHRAYGRVAGRFDREGGPLGPIWNQPPVVPLSGTIVFWRRDHRTVRVHVSKSGKFLVSLAPGTYEVWGRAAGLPVCRVRGMVKVTADRTKHVRVVCIAP
jgi:hypothetical protein